MPEVSFYADKTNSSPPADAWTWQRWISWYLRLAIALTLLVAGSIASVKTLAWNIQLTNLTGGIVLTSFLVGMMAARHYFKETHPALARFALLIWVAVLGTSIFAAASAISDISPLDTPESLYHELELCNARNYPPKYVIAEKRVRAMQFCPDYEQWFTYVFHTQSCMDARAFEEDLARYDRCDFADRKLMYIKRHPSASASWFPGWPYVAQEARLLPMRALLVLVTGTAFWGFVEAMNVVLSEQREGRVSPAETSPQFNMPISTSGLNEGFEIWKRDCVGKQPGNVLSSSEVYNHYVQWVMRVLPGFRSEDVLSSNAFHTLMRGSFTTNGKAYSGIVIHDAQGIWNDIEKMKEA